MYAQFYHARMIVAAILIVGNVYTVALWSFAFARTGLRASLLIALATIPYLFLAIFVAGYAFDLSMMKRLDPSNSLYGLAYFVLQPLCLAFLLAAQTALVMWLVRTHRSNSTDGLTNR